MQGFKIRELYSIELTIRASNTARNEANYVSLSAHQPYPPANTYQVRSHYNALASLLKILMRYALSIKNQRLTITNRTYGIPLSYVLRLTGTHDLIGSMSHCMPVGPNTSRTTPHNWSHCASELKWFSAQNATQPNFPFMCERRH
jgi:hypothetical protein